MVRARKVLILFMIGILVLTPVAYIVITQHISNSSLSTNENAVTQEPSNKTITFLHDGVILNYSMIYSIGDLNTTGWGNITIVHANATDLEYNSWQFGSAPTPEELKVNIAPLMRDDVYLGSLALTQIIDTPFGKKGVDTYLRMDSGLYMRLTSVGQESGIIYRQTIFNHTNAASVILESTNESGLLNFDQKYCEKTIVPQTTISENVSKLVAQGGGEGYGGTLGSLLISYGEHLRYNLTGSEVCAILFDKDDLIWIGDHGRFTCNEMLSRFGGRVVVMDAVPEPGLYWFFLWERTSSYYLENSILQYNWSSGS